MDDAQLARMIEAAHVNGDLGVSLVEVERRLVVCWACVDRVRCLSEREWFLALTGQSGQACQAWSGVPIETRIVG